MARPTSVTIPPMTTPVICSQPKTSPSPIPSGSASAATAYPPRPRAGPRSPESLVHHGRRFPRSATLSPDERSARWPRSSSPGSRSATTTSGEQMFDQDRPKRAREGDGEARLPQRRRPESRLRLPRVRLRGGRPGVAATHPRVGGLDRFEDKHGPNVTRGSRGDGQPARPSRSAAPSLRRTRPGLAASRRTAGTRPTRSRRGPRWDVTAARLERCSASRRAPASRRFGAPEPT